MADDGRVFAPYQDNEPVAVPRLSEAAEARVREALERYPSKKSAVMPALYIAQEELGWMRPEAIRWVADRVGLPEAHVVEIASFYTMYYKRPVGRYHVQICRTLSCMVCGSRALTEAVRRRLGVEAREITKDGFWSYEEVECLGSCGTAPMVEINDVYFENLTPEKLYSLMDRIEREKPDLRYSEVRKSLGGGLPDQARSEAWKPMPLSAGGASR
jgi:NADH-quinone oxidoreductase subunit E